MLRLYDIEKEWTAHGSKPRIRGYMSMGESVPEVMTTDWKRSNTGLIAMDASLQQNWKSGSWLCRTGRGCSDTARMCALTRMHPTNPESSES